MYSRRSTVTGQTLNSSQKYANPGQHYNPWQKAKTTDGREVWIVRQDGDGKTAYWFTDQNERLTANQFDFI